MDMTQFKLVEIDYIRDYGVSDKSGHGKIIGMRLQLVDTPQARQCIASIVESDVDLCAMLDELLYYQRMTQNLEVLAPYESGVFAFNQHLNNTAVYSYESEMVGISEDVTRDDVTGEIIARGVVYFYDDTFPGNPLVHLLTDKYLILNVAL